MAIVLAMFVMTMNHSARVASNSPSGRSKLADTNKRAAVDGTRITRRSVWDKQTRSIHRQPISRLDRRLMFLNWLWRDLVGRKRGPTRLIGRGKGKVVRIQLG